MKRKTMTLVLCLLAALALVSVGFASWVIASDAHDDVTGNIVVDTVADKRLNVTVTPTDASFVFGYLESQEEGKWFYNDPTDVSLKEKLDEVTFVIKVTDGDNNPIDPASIKLTLTADEKYTIAANANLVTKLPTSITANKTEKGTYNAKIKLGWGEKFGSVNPYTFFADKNIGDVSTETGLTWGAYAAKYMKEVENLKNVKFTLTVNVSNKNA